MSLDDLKAIANDTSGKYSTETRQAAQYLVDNPTEFTKIDGSGVNGKPDTFISKSEIRGYFARSPGAPDNVYKAAQVLVDDPLVTDGLMSTDDLKKIANDPKYGQKTRDAAQFLADNPTEFKKVDLDNNGFLSKEELQKSLGSTDKSKSFPVSDEHTHESAKGLLDYSGLKKPFTKDDLQRVAADETAPADVRLYAQYFVEHPEELDKVDMVGKDGKTGSITEDDLNTYLSKSTHEVDVKSNATTLLNDPALSTMLDNGLSVDDLKKLAADPNTNPATKAAAQFFLDNPQDFSRLSGAANDAGKSDEHVSKQDLQTYLKPREVTLGDPQKTQSAMRQLVNDGAVTFPLGIGDLERIRDDNSGKYSKETKDAAQYLLDNRAEFDSVDGTGSNALDGIISIDQAKNYLLPPVSPENTQKMASVLTHQPFMKWPLTKEFLKEVENDPNRSFEARQAAKYFGEHPEQFDKVEVFKPIEGVSTPPEDTDENTLWAVKALEKADHIYYGDGQEVGWHSGMTLNDLYGIANNPANTLEVRQAALYFAQHGHHFDNIEKLVSGKNGEMTRADLHDYRLRKEPDPVWEPGYRDKGYDVYYGQILLDHMNSKGLSSMTKEDLEKIRDNGFNDKHLREAAAYVLSHDVINKDPNYGKEKGLLHEIVLRAMIDQHSESYSGGGA